MKFYTPEAMTIEPGQVSEFPLCFLSDGDNYPYRVFIWQSGTITEVLNPKDYVHVPMELMTEFYAKQVEFKFNLLFSALDIKPKEESAFVHVMDKDLVLDHPDTRDHGFALLAGVRNGE